MSSTYEEIKQSYLDDKEAFNFENEGYDSSGNVKQEMSWNLDRTRSAPVEGKYTVTDFSNDEEVQDKFELFTDYLAEQRGIGAAIFDPATSGKQTDMSEFFRDDVMRIGTKLVKANALKDAPEDVKEAYRFAQARWELASITGVGETVEAVKDYSIDAVFNAETIASIGAAIFSGGATVPADIARRTAGMKALDVAVRASQVASTKNPLLYSVALGSAYGGADNLAHQELDKSLDKRTTTDLTDTAIAVGAGALIGGGIYGLTRLGARALSRGTDTPTEMNVTDEMFEQADFPKSAAQLLEDANNIIEGSYTATTTVLSPQQRQTAIIEELNVDEFVKDIGGGEQTKDEIKDAIRLAVSQETTADGVKSKVRQEIFKVYSNITGNWLGKAAGTLSPLANISPTAKVLQSKFSYEFATGGSLAQPNYAAKAIGKDLSEAQAEATGGFNQKFHAIIEDLYPLTASGSAQQKGKKVDKINEVLMLALRDNQPVVFEGLDAATAKTINKAAGQIRELYREMGVALRDIEVLDELVENYVPRMWDRKAIEANPEKLAALFERQDGWKGGAGSGKETVDGMLDVTDQFDFTAQRKITSLENDADFQEFLNNDVLGSLHSYTFQAGKSIAKHRVLGVNGLYDREIKDEAGKTIKTIAGFKTLWTNKIKKELAAKGENLSDKEAERINLLYRTATGEGMERYGKHLQTAADTYGFVNRVGMLGLATVSSLTEVFINLSKAGVVNSVKGFGEALEISFKGLTGDLESQLRTRHGLTSREAFAEMRKHGVAMDQALAQQGNRLAGDDLMNETLQNASNKFFKLTLLDQWTKFVQTTSYASGKNLINENLKMLAANGGNLTSKRLRTRAGELAELGIDYKAGIKWFNGGSKKTDKFYDESILGGAARYSNSVVLQPTAMSGLKPLLHSNPKTSIAFQLLGYPVAFSNTVLKGAAKSLIKDPVRNSWRIGAAGLIMTEMARVTNFWRSDGRSEEGKEDWEIRAASIARWGGNGILLDMFQRARQSSLYTRNASPYFFAAFGPAGSDLLKLQQQGVVPLVGGKVPFISGSYSALIPEPFEDDFKWAVKDYKQALKRYQKQLFTDPLVKVRGATPPRVELNKGGEVDVPNAPVEPDERIDKVTGEPYNRQAGSAFMDETDPLKVMMNVGSLVAKPVTKAIGNFFSSRSETLTKNTGNLINKETVDKVAFKIDQHIKNIGLDTKDLNLNEYVEALTVNALVPDVKQRSLPELKQISAWRKAMENDDDSKREKLWGKAQVALGVPEEKARALETIKNLQDSVDPTAALQSVFANSLADLTDEYRRLAGFNNLVSTPNAQALDIGVDLSLAGGKLLKKYTSKDVETMNSAISGATAGTSKADKLINTLIEAGRQVAIRLNLNSKVPAAPENIKAKLQTVHNKTSSGKALSYMPTATVENVKFSVSQAGRRDIAAKIKGLDVKEAKNKFPAMSVNGSFVNNKTVFDFEGDDLVEIGFNPAQHHLFIDLSTGQAVKEAKIATVIGDRVYAKGVTYWKKADAESPLKASDGTDLSSSVRYAKKSGGLVLNALKRARN